MKEKHKEIIIALAEGDMKPSKAAEITFSHRNTILYHAKQIKAETGLDPLKFYDLCKLLEMVKENK